MVNCVGKLLNLFLKWRNYSAARWKTSKLCRV